MNGRQLTDAQISLALHAHLPERAAAGLRERVLEGATSTAQLRPMPAFLASLTDADPTARRRSLLLAAALLIALTLAVAAGVGAWLQLRRETEPISLEPPPNVDAYVIGAYEGLVDIPALTFTVVDTEDSKARYFYDGAGTIRYDHWSNPANSQPTGFRLFTRDEMGERANLNGQPVWLQYGQQGNPLSQIAFATGLPATCGAVWEYVGLEYLIGRPTHHVACGGSAMWMDVETTIPLRSINAQGGGLPTIEYTVLELRIGPQPPELFVPPEGAAVMSELEYNCAKDPVCESPATPVPTDRPIVTPLPAPGQFAAPPDANAFVAEVLAGYATLPPLEMTVDANGGRTRYLYDGSGRQRHEWYYDPAKPPTVSLLIDGHWYESFGLSPDGRSVWQDHGPQDVPGVMDFGLGWKCIKGWEHRGFDLVNDRPAHHLACGDSEVWVDRKWLMAVRSQRKSDPLGYDTNVDELVDLQFVQPPAELFELPKDACVATGRPLGCTGTNSPNSDPSG
jgi:hypothetical protein